MWWLQTTEAVVLGSKPAFLTVERSEDRQTLSILYCKISGQRGKPPLKAKKERKNNVLPDCSLKGVCHEIFDLQFFP